MLSLRDSLRSSTHEGIRWRHRHNSSQRMRNFGCTYKSRCPTAHERKSFWEPFLKNKVPMLLKQPPTFFLQEAHTFDSKTSTRPTYDISCKGCSQRHQGQGVQKVCPMRTSSGTLCAWKGSCPRNGLPSQKWPEPQDYHWGRCGTMPAHLALQNTQGISHVCDFSPQCKQETVHLQGLQGSLGGLSRSKRSGKASKGCSGPFHSFH